MDVSGSYPNNIQNIATSYTGVPTLRRSIAPNRSIRCNVTDAVRAMMAQAEFFNKGNIQGIYGGAFTHLRMKIGVWLAPGWWYPTNALTNYTSNNGTRWSATGGRTWNDFERTVTFYTAADGNDTAKLPELSIKYSLN